MFLDNCASDFYVSSQDVKPLIIIPVEVSVLAFLLLLTC